MKTLPHRLRLLTALAVSAAFLAGCADLKDKLPAPTSPGISVHPAGWADTASAEFHGKAIAAAGSDMRSCRTCHGTSYTGGVAEVSCNTCHTDAGGPENCTTCHGGPNSPAPPRDVAGNTATTFPGVGAHAKHVLGGTLGAKVWCYECHTVPASVYSPGHVDSDLPAEVPMNGPLARTSTGGLTPVPVHDYGALTCANTYCHGDWRFRKSDSEMKFVYADSAITGANASPVWTGGSAEAACGSCHALPPAGHRPYQITECVNCHSPVVDASGKIKDVSLHINGKVDVGFGTPVNCSACHGSPATPAPPRDIAGDTATSAPGVGAHSSHVLGGPLSAVVACSECHVVPASVEAPGHMDTDLPAEVAMNGPLGTTVSYGVTPVPVHDYGTLKCSNTYCHGDWRASKASSPNQFAYMDSVIVGANASPVWNGGPSEAACGTCHGLPPTGHIPAVITACANCHTGVVDPLGNIADKTLHINGKINVFGTERDF